MGRNEVSFPRGASWVERICPSLLSLSSKEVYFETFYPFPGWGDEGFSDGGKGVWTARGAGELPHTVSLCVPVSGEQV